MARPPEDEPFLNRWSKRKRAAEVPSKPLSEPEPLPEPQAAPDVISEEELAALPSIEELTFGTDIRPFLRKGVPQAMRNAALRKMWMLTPAIRDHADPAVDYAWDWNTPGGVPGDGAAPTPERAAKMLRDLMEPRPAPEPVQQDASPALQEENSADQPTVPAEASPDSLAEKNPAANRKPQEKQEQEVQISTLRKHGGALPS